MTSRRGPVGLVLAAAVVFAACIGTSATPAASSGGSAAPAGNPANSSGAGAPGASRGSAASGPTGSSVFGTAADKLDGLTSYRFSVSIDTTTAGKTQKIAMSGTVINSPTRSYALQLDMAGALTGAVVIGSDAWVRQGTAGYQQVGAAMAESFIASLSAFRPEKLFALAFGINGDRFSKVADEDRNGVPCTHYKGNDSLSAIYSGMFGITASFSSDVWIARNGGFLVASEIRTSSTAASASGAYSSVVNVTNVNDSSNKVDRPS